jgi:hypothetical protein
MIVNPKSLTILFDKAKAPKITRNTNLDFTIILKDSEGGKTKYPLTVKLLKNVVKIPAVEEYKEKI